MSEHLTPAQVSTERLIPGATHPKTVRDLCAARQIEHIWNGRDGKQARYWITRNNGGRQLCRQA